MDVRGFNLSGGITAAAEGLAELAIRLKEAAADKPYHLKFCTATFKDAGQLRNRFKRRGQATLRPYEVLSDDDTVLFGAIPASLEDAQDDMNELRRSLAWPKGWLRYDAVHQRIELPLSWLKNWPMSSMFRCSWSRSIPTHERLEVGVVHLNDHR